MTTHSAPTTTSPSPRLSFLSYFLIPIVLLASWTLVRYTNQPYRSPTYRRTLTQCLTYALWTVPTEGSGPLVLVILRIPDPGPNSSFLWKAPLFGAIIYIALAISLLHFGRRWSPLIHVLIATAWLLSGEIIYTAITMK